MWLKYWLTVVLVQCLQFLELLSQLKSKSQIGGVQASVTCLTRWKFAVCRCESDRDWSESGVTLWIQMSLLFFLSFLGMRWEFRSWRKSLVNNCFSKGTLLTTTEERVNQDRQKKLLNVFTIVNFPNNECTAGSTNTSGDMRCNMENVGGSSQWKN